MNTLSYPEAAPAKFVHAIDMAYEEGIGTVEIDLDTDVEVLVRTMAEATATRWTQFAADNHWKGLLNPETLSYNINYVSREFSFDATDDAGFERKERAGRNGLGACIVQEGEGLFRATYGRRTWKKIIGPGTAIIFAPSEKLTKGPWFEIAGTYPHMKVTWIENGQTIGHRESRERDWLDIGARARGMESLFMGRLALRQERKFSKVN